MSHRMVTSPDLPPPAAAYSHAVVANGLVFVAGQIPVDDSGAVVGEGDIDAQTRQVFANLERVLTVAGASLGDLVSVTAYLTEFAVFKEYDRVYGECLGDHRPARATIGANLALPGLMIEIQAIAALPDG